MNTATPAAIKSNLSVLGIYQIAGGSVGALLVFWFLLNSAYLAPSIILVALFMLLFFGFSILCGVLCLKANKAALNFSLVNQVLQVVGFAASGFAFFYAAGIYIRMGLDLRSAFELTLGMGISELSFNVNKDSDRLEITVNVVAIVIIYWIGSLKKKIEVEDQLQKIEKIGTS